MTVRWTGPRGPSNADPMQSKSTLPFRPHRRLRRSFRGPLLGLVLGASLFLGSCASSGPPSENTSSGGGQRVVLHDYLGGRKFEIVSESYADPLEYLSEKRTVADRKFLPDDALGAFLDYLHDKGMAEYAQAGRAPTSGRDVLTRAFEVERDGRITCWPIGKGTEREEKTAFTVLMAEYLQLYTEVPAFQVLENPEGKDLFRDAERQKTGR